MCMCVLRKILSFLDMPVDNCNGAVQWGGLQKWHMTENSLYICQVNENGRALRYKYGSISHHCTIPHL